LRRENLKVCEERNFKSEFDDNTLHILMINFQRAMYKGRDTLDTHLNEEGLNMTIYLAGVEEYGKILLMFTEPLNTTDAIFSAPAILSEFQKKSVPGVSEDPMKAAIMSAAPTRSGWAP
jgi:hypothetical protein